MTTHRLVENGTKQRVYLEVPYSALGHPPEGRRSGDRLDILLTTRDVKSRDAFKLASRTRPHARVAIEVKRSRESTRRLAADVEGLLRISAACPSCRTFLLLVGEAGPRNKLSWVLNLPAKKAVTAKRVVVGTWSRRRPTEFEQKLSKGGVRVVKRRLCMAAPAWNSKGTHWAGLFEVLRVRK
jgi:hypothetical protein